MAWHFGQMIMWRKTDNQHDDAGVSLLETALVLPLMIVLLLFAIDFGYFFLVAGNMVTAARNAVLYSAQGFDSIAQQQIPSAGTAGSLADTAGVAGLAGGDMSGLAQITTGTSPNPQVYVCSKGIGVTAVKSGSNTTGYRTNCATFPSGTLSYTPDVDPESLNGMLTQRVDVVYKVNLPISLRLFSFNTLPPVTFHWQVEMRAID